MYKKTMIASGIAMAVAGLPVMADGHGEESNFWDEWEISGELKNETAVFTTGGQTIGQATSTTDTTTKHDSGDVYKSESSAKIFVNGDVGEEGSSFHAELNLRYDTEAIDGYKGAKSYSQHDLVRELYVDTEVGDEDNPVSVRAGKQQVVWGTADGIKLLDMINPTDWREFAQNTMADSRIPVWMINAETDLENGGNLQVVVSQAEANKIPGLSIASGSATSHANGDQGQPFVMKGVDTVTGKTNGFLNLAPAMGQVATYFAKTAAGGTISANTLYANYKGATVNEFSTDGTDATNFKGLCGGNSDANCLYSIANSSAQGNNNYITNLSDVSTDAGAGVNGSQYDVSNPNSVFEYMDETTFATFYSFANMTSEYKVDHPDDLSSNLSARFKGTMDNGLNYSINYSNRYDSNPYVSLGWEDKDGNSLSVVYENSQLVDNDGDGATETGTGTHTTVTLRDSSNTVIDVSTASNNYANLVFTEKLNRVNVLGGSFDYALDTESMPVVLRGEAIYEKGVKVPVVNRAAISIGDLEMGLRNEEADFFKYVIGADVNVMTNLMLSGQFIQFRNLDYIDETTTPTRGGVTSQISGARYTADPSVMHLTNGLQKAEKNKEFYSLFMSKPFGAEQQHRWNNIFMFEENGGKWNRFDVEYSFDDELIGTAEYNKYWGDENTQFGQMANSSNFQLGLKYIF